MCLPPLWTLKPDYRLPVTSVTVKLYIAIDDMSEVTVTAGCLP